MKFYGIDGHNYNEIIAKTIKGKGVSFMENEAKWHGKAPKEEEYLEAIKELELSEKNI